MPTHNETFMSRMTQVQNGILRQVSWKDVSQKAYTLSDDDWAVYYAELEAEYGTK